MAVTEGAREVPEGAKSADWVLAAIVGSVIDAGELVGLERSQLLQRLGLQLADFADPDALLPFESYVSAWEALAAAPGSEDIGLRLGALSSPRLTPEPIAGVAANELDERAARRPRRARGPVGKYCYRSGSAPVLVARTVGA